MKQRKELYFRDELRKVLIFHTLTPWFISFIILILVFSFIGAKQIIKKNNLILKEHSINIEKLIDSYVDKSEILAIEIDIEKFINESNYKTEEISKIYNFLNSKEYRGEYYLFNNEKEIIFSTDNRKYLLNSISNCLDFSIRNKKEYILIYNNEVNSNKLPAFIIFKKIINNKEFKGYSGFVLYSDDFKNELINTDESIIISNNFDRIFISSDKKFQDDRGKLPENLRNIKDNYKKLINFNNKFYYVASSHILKYNLKIISIYNCTFFIQLCTSLLCLSFLFIIIASLAIYNSAGKAVDKKIEILYELIKALDEVEKGNLNIHLNINTRDEFEHIANSFNTMIGSIRHLLLRHQELAKENILTNMLMLKTQFNPHFLFNTLESIRYMIKFDPKSAQNMVLNLSKMLRYSIENDRDVILLEEELDFLNNYIKLMLIRYGERLSYDLDISDNTKKLFIPKMCLQTIFENSIKYGFGDKKEYLNINIKSYIHNNLLYIIIKDNGIGINKEKLEEIKNNLNNKQNKLKNIGLYNINKRIKLMYGNEYGVFITSIEDKETIVKLILPINN